MLIVVACLLPGIATQSIFFGSGVIGNVVVALFTALATEVICLRLTVTPSAQKAVIAPAAASGAVTALILAAALPPATDWGIVAFAAVTAISLGKYAYGGLGNNVFNPAMVGYAVVLVSFPGALASWPAATDSLSGATVLTTLKFRGGATIEDIWLIENGFGTFGGIGWEWCALAFFGGGLVLVLLRLAAWRTSVGMLVSLGMLSLMGYDYGSSDSSGSPLFHLFSGGTMLAAFFVVTDPVSHPASLRGQWLFGVLVGTITYAIRVFGNYPDGIAFAVLLANAATPYLNHRLTRTRTQPDG